MNVASSYEYNKIFRKKMEREKHTNAQKEPAALAGSDARYHAWIRPIRTANGRRLPTVGKSK